MHLLVCAHLIIFLGVLNLDIITSTPPFECLHCVICVLSVTATVFFLLFLTLHNDCSHIEDVHREHRSRADFGLVPI